MKVVIMDEPTKGVDVGAKAEIYQIMGDLAKKKDTVFFSYPRRCRRFWA